MLAKVQFSPQVVAPIFANVPALPFYAQKKHPAATGRRVLRLKSGEVLKLTGLCAILRNCFKTPQRP